MNTEVSAKRSRSSEKCDMSKLEATFKRFNEACDRNVQVHNQTAEHIKEIAKRNHDSYEKAKREQRKQENDRVISKATKEKRLSDIEARLNVMFYGFESIKKASDKSINSVDTIVRRMDAVLDDVMIIRERCDAKDAEILELHNRLNHQDKEIEVLKGLIHDQQRMLELYMQLNAKPLNDRPF